MNALEKEIHSGMLYAHKKYVEMTDYWLSHAPESYITVVVAQQIVRKLDFSVYIDTSLKKILSPFYSRWFHS